MFGKQQNCSFMGIIDISAKDFRLLLTDYIGHVQPLHRALGHKILNFDIR